MDPVVQAALAKWPNVPHCHGWLALDRRGQWLLGGEILRHAGLKEFIERNYDHDERGRWYFQNGPQRVYVTLAYLPLVARLENNTDLRTHTGQAIGEISRAWLDLEGSLLLETEYGPALLDDRDLNALLPRIHTATDADLSGEALEAFHQGTTALKLRWQGRLIELHSLRPADAPALLGFDPAPQPQT